MKYTAALFDFDYTLGDATDSIYEGHCYAFEQMGYPKPRLEDVRRMVGYLLEDGFTQLTGEGDQAKREQFRVIYKDHVRGTQAKLTRLCPGARELLEALHDRGIKVGIVSSKHLDTLWDIFRYHKIADLIDFAIGGETVKRPKPDPEGLNTAIATFGVDKAHVLYCGDTTIDAETGRSAGVDFSAVLNGVTPASDFEAYPHVHIAPDLGELKSWLGI